MAKESGMRINAHYISEQSKIAISSESKVESDILKIGVTLVGISFRFRMKSLPKPCKLTSAHKHV